MDLQAEFAIPPSASRVIEWESGGGGSGGWGSGASRAHFFGGGELTNIQKTAASTITIMEEWKKTGKCLQSEASLAAHQEEARLGRRQI